MNDMKGLTITCMLLVSHLMLFFTSTALYADDKRMDHFELGVIYLSEHKYEKALTNLESAIKNDPDCSKCYFARGYALENLGRTFEALVDYDRAIKLNPRDTNIYFYRGMLRMLQPADRMQAIADFTRCLQMDPMNEHRYYRARATAHSLNSQPEKALRDYDQAVKSGDKDSALLYNIGGCYLELNKYEKALDSLMEAVKIDPNNDMALLSIAKIHAHKNQKKDAIKYLKLAVQKDRHVSKYGIAKDDQRWNNIRDTKEFQRLKNAPSVQPTPSP